MSEPSGPGPARPTGPELSRSDPPGEKPRALVIDPNAAVGELLARTLRGHGYEVTQVTHWPGWSALGEPGRADVVVVEPMLPSWAQGLALCRAIREGSHIPVVFVTSRCLEDDISQALAAGAADVICKPFSPTNLVARVDTAMGRSEASAGFRHTCLVGPPLKLPPASADCCNGHADDRQPPPIP
jgi:DNA-binding response OmpR family regulator